MPIPSQITAARYDGASASQAVLLSQTTIALDLFVFSMLAP